MKRSELGSRGGPTASKFFRRHWCFGDGSAALPRDLAGKLRRVGLRGPDWHAEQIGLRIVPWRRHYVLELASVGIEVRQKRTQFLGLVGGVADNNPHAPIMS